MTYQEVNEAGNELVTKADAFNSARALGSLLSITRVLTSTCGRTGAHHEPTPAAAECDAAGLLTTSALSGITRSGLRINQSTPSTSPPPARSYAPPPVRGPDAAGRSGRPLEDT